MGVLVACYRFRVTSYEFATSYKLQVTGYKLQVPGLQVLLVQGCTFWLLVMGYDRSVCGY